MIRLLIFLVTGLLCAIGGVLIGVSSHQVAYRDPGREIVAHFLSGGKSSSNRIGYLQMVDDDNLYILNEDDFSPPVKDNSFGDGDSISFIYRPVDTTGINVSATNTSTHLQGQAYMIEQLTVLPGNSSNVAEPVTYTSSEYSKNPRGYFQSNWMLGGGLLGLGLLLVVVGFVLQLLGGRRKKAEAEINVSTGGDLNGAADPSLPLPLRYAQGFGSPGPLHHGTASTSPLAVAMPMGQYEQHPAFANQQPFQNFAQYPQVQQYSPSPGQYNWPEGAAQDDQPVEQQQQRRQFQPRPGQFKSPQSLS